MEYLVLADYKTKQGMANDMAAIFKEALVETRAFEGCNAIDVYFEEKTSTFTLVEDWKSLEHYEIYLQWRIDGGSADLLDRVLEGGWLSVIDSVKSLGSTLDIYLGVKNISVVIINKSGLKDLTKFKTFFL